MKTIKSVLFSGFLFTILFSCALKPTEIEKEKKDYQGTIHNVENANYEFEERLNSFYESEHIASKDLDTLYKGEYPDGETEPTMLRIHWQKARELAIAELELQKAIQTNWQEAKISLRPVLALDRDGGDYYRYYEYRVLKDDNAELGAIRIPVYRRTENFATSEVHLYSGDGKTYKLTVSMWGLYLSGQVIEDKNTDFFKTIKNTTGRVVTDGFVFNFLYFIYDELGLKEKVTDISVQDAYNQLYSEYKKNIGQISGTKKPIPENDKKPIIDGAARKNTYDYRDTLTSVKQLLFKLESIATITESYKESLHVAVSDSASIEFFQGLSFIYIMMTGNKADTLVAKTIKDIYWDNLENKDKDTVRKYLLEKKWNIYKELDDREIKPVIEYPEYAKYPQREITGNTKYKFQEYQLLPSSDEHKKLIHSVSGFVSKDGFKSSLFSHMKDANGHEFSGEELHNFTKKDDTMKNFMLRSASTTTHSDTTKDTTNTVIDLIHSVTKTDVQAGLSSVDWDIAAFNTNIPVLISFSNPVILAPLTGIAAITGLIFDLVKDQVYQYANILDNILKTIDKELGKEGLQVFVDNISLLKKEKPFKSSPVLKDLISIAEVVGKNYITHGPESVKDAFLKAYDYWFVWWLFIPGWWTVNKGHGKIEPPSHYAQSRGFPILWTFNLDNLVPRDKNPPEIDRPQLSEKPKYPELEIVPDELKPYGWEWLSLYNWFTNNRMYDFDDNGNPSYYRNLKTDDVENILITLTDNLYDLYSGTSSVYIEKDKPYSIATNVITNKVVIGMDEFTKKPIYEYEYITNTKENVIINPSKEEKDLQNNFNINKLKDIINKDYSLNLGNY